MSDKAVLRLDTVERTFLQGKNRLEVLRGANLTVYPGEIIALVGPSGAGKSTLLHIAGLLESPDKGEVWIAGRPASNLKDDERTRLRRHFIGFVYQYHHLLPEFSALENVIIPQMVAGLSKDQAFDRAMGLLRMMGLEARADHRPGRLSGGEQQRVAIARALANAPHLLMADEPTGNLDPKTAADVFGLLVRLVRSAGLAAIMATHNPDLAAQADRTIRLEDGILVEG